MIPGTTYEQRRLAREAYDASEAAREKELETPRPWYAWHPVELDDGRWAWLQTVTRYRSDKVDQYHRVYRGWRHRVEANNG